MRSILLAFFFVLALALPAASVHAEEFSWRAPVSGPFDDEDYWLPGGIPGALDTAIFNLGSSGYVVHNFDPVGRVQVNDDTVTFSGNVPTGWLQMGTNAGDIADLSYQSGYFIAALWEVGVHPEAEATFRAHSAALITSPNEGVPPHGRIVIGAGGKGTLLAFDSGLGTAGSIVVGRDATAEGKITSEDGNLSAVQELIVGLAGKGSATISDNGLVSVGGKFVMGQNAGSDGEIRLGSASRFEGRVAQQRMTEGTIGDAGKGTFVAEGASDIRMSGAVTIGNQEGSDGLLHVKGDRTALTIQRDSQTSDPSVVIGNSGKGRLEISDTAQANIGGSLVLGKEATGDGTLTVRHNSTTGNPALSVSSFPQEMIVGDAGKGLLKVADGAKADVRRPLTIGRQAGSQGEVLVETNSRLSTEGFEIGPEGEGRLTIRGKSVVEVWGASIQNHGGGTIDINDATLIGNIYNPATPISNAGRVINNGRIVGDLENLPGGTLSGNGVYQGVITQAGGTLSPGNSPGTLLLDELLFDAGTIEFEISQAEGEAGQQFGWDLIAVAGEASFSGPFTLDLVSLTLPHLPGPVLNFDPASNYSWTFLTAGAGISGFDPSLVTIETGRFENPHPGTFFVSQVGGALALNYVVPEPGSIVLAGIGIAALLAVYRERKK